MICLIQRVTYGRVEVDGDEIGAIGPGLVVLTGFEPDDNSEKINKMLHKLLHYRLFADENDKMNLNVQQVGGGLLLVPQFTLAADTRSGLRPSFSSSAPPAQATVWFDEFVAKARQKYNPVQTGEFGTDMQVSLCNDGPVTFWLQV
ncbi:D-aminoacyl-tRNA deacylase [Thiomicrorhabdus xiamenensis]|uniref:D-aminoacyl-tRNA deacylase n=1 Tax=Thiomicrorhabdus xiamenensis TaxID=2739063 RepID=A0A7D4TCW6_9GAMM|nr:D-aminoacyl-tRNA deacylase [Thiomicrorhabdus xiamenensis]QKI88267.1 D-tyrosyl-tRNA(Tyr) deacylase [Thiomicrorhabdus xiamenensis]